MQITILICLLYALLFVLRFFVFAESIQYSGKLQRLTLILLATLVINIVEISEKLTELCKKYKQKGWLIVNLNNKPKHELHWFIGLTTAKTAASVCFGLFLNKYFEEIFSHQ